MMHPFVALCRDVDAATRSLLTVEESLGQQFVGSPAGSALFALAAALPFVLNSSVFAAAALLILTVRGVRKPVRAAGRTSVRADVAEEDERLVRELNIKVN